MIAKDTTTIVRFYVTTTDGFPATGQSSNISASISLDGDTATAITATISESDSTNLPGWYEFEYTFSTAGNAFITFTCANCRIMPWEENVVEVSGSSAPTAAEVADAVWCWTASAIPGQTSVIPGQNSIYTKVTNIPASVWTNDTRSLTTEVISVNKSLATDISASSIANAVWGDTTNYLNSSSKGYMQIHGADIWSQVAIHDPVTGADTTYGAVLKSRASSSNVTDAKTAIIRAMPDISGLSTFDPSTDTVTINATQAATMVTATGFATPSDLAGLSTFDPANDTVTINSTQAATMITADVSGLATPADIPTGDISAIKAKVDSLHNTDLTGVATSANVTAAQTAIIEHGDSNWTGGSSGGATAQQIWEYPTRTITASPTDVSGLATASDLSAVASNVAAVKAKTDNLPASPAATGDAMTLTSAYDAAKTASQLTASDLPSDYAKPGDAMTLTAAYDAAKTASQLTASDLPSDYAKPGDAMTLTAVYDAAKTASQLTASDLPSDYAKPGDAMTLTSTYDAAKTASQLTSADLSGLSTFDPTNDTVLIDATQAAGMATATGFATPSDVSGAVSALETYGDNHWTGGSSGGATAQQIWEYPTRTITASPTDISGLATSSDLSAVASNVTAIKTKTDNLPASPAATGDIPSVASIQSGLAKTSDLSGLSTFNAATDTVLIDATQAAGMATATGFATPSDIPTDYAKATDIPTSDISAIKAKTDNLPASPAATGDIPTSKINSVYAGLYNWRLQNNGTVEKITAKDASGNTLAQSTITRDNDGNIIRMDEEA